MSEADRRADDDGQSADVTEALGTERVEAWAELHDEVIAAIDHADEAGVPWDEIGEVHGRWKRWYKQAELLLDARAPVQEVRDLVSGSLHEAYSSLARDIDDVERDHKLRTERRNRRLEEAQHRLAERAAQLEALNQQISGRYQHVADLDLPAPTELHVDPSTFFSGIQEIHDTVDNWHAELLTRLRNTDATVRKVLDKLVRQVRLRHALYSVGVTLGAFALLPLLVQAATGWSPPLWQAAVLTLLLWLAQPAVEKGLWHTWLEKRTNGAAIDVYLASQLLTAIHLHVAADRHQAGLATES